MQKATIFLVHLPEALRAAASEAGRAAFPGAELVAVRTVAEAAKRPPAARELVVLAGGDEAEAAAATQVADRAGLPRWAAVTLGGGLSHLLESVPAEECQPPALARVFRLVAQQHEFARENAQLRGDLKTVARRVAHDLFTPLNCIHLTSEALGSLPGADEAALKEKADTIQDMLAEASSLINRVSFVLSASSNGPAPVVIAMDAVVENVLQQLNTQIREAGATVRHPPNWPEVIGVASWLEVVWWNLITNALKHGRPSGPIQLGWSRRDGVGRFWVANRGEAVPAIQLDRLFQPFERLHTAPAPGLGLSLVRRLVSLQGGECGYERGEDGSSVFYFTLPAPEAGAVMSA